MIQRRGWSWLRLTCPRGESSRWCSSLLKHRELRTNCPSLVEENHRFQGTILRRKSSGSSFFESSFRDYNVKNNFRLVKMVSFRTVLILCSTTIDWSHCEYPNESRKIRESSWTRTFLWFLLDGLPKSTQNVTKWCSFFVEYQHGSALYYFHGYLIIEKPSKSI